MFSKNNPVVILIDRSGFTLYQGTLVNIIKFTFTPDIVANLEVISREQFFALVSSFIDKSKIIPSIIIVVLADAIVYEKDLSKVPQKTQPVGPNTASSSSSQKILDLANREQESKAEIQNFLQNIPFEDILAKIIKIQTTTRLVAVNKDLIFSTTEPFVKKGFLIEAIIPAFMYGPSANLANGLTLNIAQLILRKQEVLKIANLLVDQEQTIISQNPHETEKDKEERSGKSKKNRRQLILIGIFVILFIILGIMFIMSFGGEEKNLKNNETRPSVQIISPSPTTASTSPDLPVGSSSAILGADDISITIIRNSQSLQASALLREGLIKIGFNNIVSEDSEDAVPARSSVLFSKDISTNIRQIAIAEINKIFPSALVLESENSDSEITVIVGQS